MKHTLAVLVEDKPGVLARVASLFTRRAFNIHSLAVGPIHQPGFSRITLVVDAVDVDQVTKQLRKLVNVIRIIELAPEESLEREVMLVRVEAGPENHREVRDEAEAFGASTVDTGGGSLTFELCDHPSRLADFLSLIERYGVVELVKSGRIAIARDAESRVASTGSVS